MDEKRVEFFSGSAKCGAIERGVEIGEKSDGTRDISQILFETCVNNGIY